MRLHKGTGCVARLVGQLKQLPMPSNDNSDLGYILLERHLNYSDENERLYEKSEIYCVSLPSSELSRINQFGYVGMLISVEADLRTVFGTDQSIEIIGEKIDFLHLSGQGNRDAIYSLDDETQFTHENIQKIKNSIGYQSQLFYDAINTVH